MEFKQEHRNRDSYVANVWPDSTKKTLCSCSAAPGASSVVHSSQVMEDSQSPSEAAESGCTPPHPAGRALRDQVGPLSCVGSKIKWNTLITLSCENTATHLTWPGKGAAVKLTKTELFFTFPYFMVAVNYRYMHACMWKIFSARTCLPKPTFSFFFPSVAYMCYIFWTHVRLHAWLVHTHCFWVGCKTPLPCASQSDRSSALTLSSSSSTSSGLWGARL